MSELPSTGTGRTPKDLGVWRGLSDATTDHPLLIADGAWGSNLIAAGLETSRECAEGWNLRHPERIQKLAQEFLHAGAEILSTNTFGGNRIRLARYGLADYVQAINQRGVALVREVAGPKHAIAASMGPTGLKDLRGNARAITEAYEEQAREVTEAGATLILLETMTSPEEVALALHAIKKVSSLDVVCSYAFTRSPKMRLTTWSGAGLPEAMQVAHDAGACILGANCVPADGTLLALLPELQAHAHGAPIWLKPNAGQPTARAGCLRYPNSVDHLPCTFEELSTFNVAVLGGCCGTDPRQIQALATSITAYRER